MKGQVTFMALHKKKKKKISKQKEKGYTIQKGQQTLFTKVKKIVWKLHMIKTMKQN